MMAEPLRFATADRPAGPVSLPRRPMRYQAVHWDDGCTSIRALHEDGTAGPWAHYPTREDDPKVDVPFGEGGHRWPDENGPGRACQRERGHDGTHQAYVEWPE